MPDEAVAEAPKKPSQIEKMNAARAARKAEREALAKAQQEKLAKVQQQIIADAPTKKAHPDDLDDEREQLEYADVERTRCTCGQKLFRYKGKSKFHCRRFLKGGEPTKVCQKNLPAYGVDEEGNKITLIYVEGEAPPPNVDVDDEKLDLES